MHGGNKQFSVYAKPASVAIYQLALKVMRLDTKIAYFNLQKMYGRFVMKKGTVDFVRVLYI